MGLAAKFVPGLLRFTSTKIVRVTMELEVPKCLFLGLHYPFSWSIMFYGERGKHKFSRCKSQGIVAKKCRFNILKKICTKGGKVKHEILY